HDQVEDVANGTDTLTGLPVVFPRHDKRQAGKLVGQRPCASLDKAVCVVCARSGARLSTAAIATAQVIVLVRIGRIRISCSCPYSDCCVMPIWSPVRSTLISVLTRVRVNGGRRGP